MTHCEIPKFGPVTLNELRKKWKEQIAHFGLKRAVKVRLDKINSVTQYLPCLYRREIQENLAEILELIDIAEGDDF